GQRHRVDRALFQHLTGFRQGLSCRPQFLVGASLLANAVGQQQKCSLTLRFREQARSHIRNLQYWQQAPP
ncbi:hypothetical protein, partial [Pseudomonas sp. R62]|uniref:hypothetical protein n=1 Tax=Pseudomonas sp. R62 TaxID=1144884 RepID=UPI001EE691D7